MTDGLIKPITPWGNEKNASELPNATESSGAQGKEAVKDVVCGSVSRNKLLSIPLSHNGFVKKIAGIAGKIIEYPFDTVKVRLQSQPDRPPYHYAGPIDCFQKSLRAEGVRGLYRGISAPLVGAAIETSSLFFSYRIAQSLLKATFPQPDQNTPLSLKALIACGGTSGAFTSLLLTPIELIKCQMQVPLSSSSRGHKSPGPLSIITSIFRNHGILGFWHGQLGTLIRETGGSAAWFGVYEGVSSSFRSRNQRRRTLPATADPHSTTQPQLLPIWQQMVAGACAGVSYILGFFPADTIKSRMQTDTTVALSPGTNTTTAITAVVGNKGPGRGTTFWASGVSLWRQQGIRGLYRGCGITVARAAPSSAFIFAIYEGLRGAYG